MPTVAECEKYLRGLITKREAVGVPQRLNLRYLRINFIFYCWIVQQYRFSVDREAILALLGVEEGVLDWMLNDTEDRLYEFIEVHGRELMLISQMKQAAHKVYNDNDPAFQYNVSLQLPYFDPGYTGVELVKAISGLEPERPVSTINSEVDRHIADTIEKALRAALPGINVETTSSSYPHIRLVRGPEGDTGPLWNFVFVVLSIKQAPTKDLVKMVMADLAAVGGILRRDYGIADPKTLFISPSIHNDEIIEFLQKNYVGTYHCWSLSVVRLFHQLHEVMKGNEQRAAEEFMSIFDGQKASFSSALAARNLKKKLSNQDT